MKITRTRARASGALATGLAAALAFSTLVAAPATAAPAPAAAAAPQAVPAGASTVSDAVFHWGINNEVSNRAFAPGTYNFMSAGKAPKTSGGDTISESEWSATDGNVTIEKKQADGTSYATATWAGLKTTPTGATIPSPSSGQFSGHRVAISSGTGTLDAEADNADIQWDGDFTVAFYSGMTQFYVSDPHLMVEGGVGSITATLSGFGSDMNDPEVFVTLPDTEVTLADLSGVDVTSTGIEVTPDYLGVTANLPESATPQATTGNSWGAFPESMVNFQLLTGQSSYWYSSGGATDSFKVALPISIGYTAVAPEPEPEPEDTVVDGAQLEWAYSRYAQYGVFGAWSMKASGADVSTGTANGKAITGLDADASKTFNLVRFEDGEGTLDAETGAGTISWADTGDWVLNAYNGQYGAPDETLRDPILTINADGTGDLSFEAYIPAGLDMSGNEAPASGPSRIAIATFSSVSVDNGVITVQPDFAGRSYSTTVGSPWASCDGAGGSWPTAWIDFLPTSVQAHYYSTSCSGLNLMKPPVKFTVALNAADAAITSQPVAASVDAGGTATFQVAASGNPLAFQWQKKVAGGTWTAIEGATDSKVSIVTTPADDGAQVRVVVNGSITSDAATLTVRSEAPTLLFSGDAETVAYEGSFVSLGTYASGIPEPTKQWQISRDGGATWENSGDPVGVSDTLNIVPSQSDDGLLARSVFSNGVGSDVTSEPQKLTVVAFSGPSSMWVLGAPVSLESITNQDVTLRASFAGFTVPEGSTTDIQAVLVPESALADTNTPVTTGALWYETLYASNLAGSNGHQPNQLVQPWGEIDPSQRYYLVTYSTDLTDRSYDSRLLLPIEGQVTPEAPEITSQPTSTSVANGATATFSVTATATPSPTYQWQSKATGVEWTDIDGATGASYSLTAALGATGTSFRVVVSNGVDSVISDAATLTVERPTPTVTVSKTTGLDANGETVTVTGSGFFPDGTTTNGARPPLAGQFTGVYVVFGKFADTWKPSDNAASTARTGIDTKWAVPASAVETIGGASAGAVELKADGTFSTTLTVKSGAFDKTGTYGVYTYGGGGVKYAPFETKTVVTLNEAAPAITTQPADSTVSVYPETGETTFTVAASGSPTPTIQWQTRAAGGEWTAIEGATAATLGVAYTKADDGVQYRAVVTNGLGSVTSDAATLHVTRPTPTVTVSKTEGLDPNGETVTVTGTGFLPDGTTTNGTRPPLAGKFAGAYVVFGKFADTWKPSENAASSARTTLDTKWGVSAADIETIGGASAGAIEIAADGTFSTTLTIKSGAFDKTGTYGVYTYGGGGVKYAPFETKTVVTLTEAAPSITTQPSSVSPTLTGTSADTATFTVAASGAPTPTLQWQKKVSGGEWTAIEGATSATLTVAFTSADTGTVYRAVATSGLGSATSNEATLTVNRPTPTVTVSKTTGLDANGETVTVTGSGFFPDGTLTNGTRPPLAGTFTGAYVVFGKFADTWKPSENAASSARTGIDTKWAVPASAVETIGGAGAGAVEIAADGTFSTTLTVKSGAFDKTGTYGVYTYGGGGVKYAPFETKTVVTLNEAAPAIGTQPGSVVAPVTPAAGTTTAEFTVAGVTGSPAPTIQWQQKVTGGDWTDIDGATAATLSKAYTAGDSGSQYRAVVTNGLGSVTSDAATLTVGVPVSIITAPAAASVVAGGENTFTASVGGDPAPAVKWQSRGASGVWTDIPGETGTSLTVAALVDGVDYRIVASNGIPTTVGGTPLPVASEAARLTVTVPAETPELLTEEELAAAPAGPVTISSIDGSTVVLSLGEEYAGQFVAVEVHSVPESLGWYTVSAAGTVTVTLPADLPLGAHTLVVRAADGSVIGTAGITVSAVDPGTGGTDGAGTGTGTTGSGTTVTATTGGGSVSALSDTGFESTGWLVFALLLLLAGAGVVTARRMRTS